VQHLCHVIDTVHKEEVRENETTSPDVLAGTNIFAYSFLTIFNSHCPKQRPSRSVHISTKPALAIVCRMTLVSSPSGLPSVPRKSRRREHPAAGCGAVCH